MIRSASLVVARRDLEHELAEKVESLEIVTYDGLRLRVGATPDDELARLTRAGGRIGEIYAARAPAGPLRGADPRAVRADPAQGVRL